jgi:hypothetical protein
MMHLQAQAFLEDLKAHRAELKAAQSTVGVEISRVETPAPKVTIAVSEAPKVTLSTDAVSSKKESSVSVGIHTTDDKDPTVEIAGGDPKVVANDRIANYIDPTGPKSQDPIVAAMQYLVDMLLIIYLNHMNEAQKAATHKSVDNCRTEFQQFAKENPEAAAAFLAQYKDTQIHRLLSHDGLGVNQARDEYYDSRTKDSPRTEIIVPRSLEGRPAGEVISKLKEMTRIDNASIVQTSLYGSTPDRLSKHVADKLASIEQKAGKSAKPSPPTSR